MGGRGSRSSAKSTGSQSTEKLSPSMKFTLSDGVRQHSEATIKKMSDAKLTKTYEDATDGVFEARHQIYKANQMIDRAEYQLFKAKKHNDLEMKQTWSKNLKTAQQKLNKENLKDEIHSINRARAKKVMLKRNLKSDNFQYD